MKRLQKIAVMIASVVGVSASGESFVVISTGVSASGESFVVISTGVSASERSGEISTIDIFSGWDFSAAGQSPSVVSDRKSGAKALWSLVTRGEHAVRCASAKRQNFLSLASVAEES